MSRRSGVAAEADNHSDISPVLTQRVVGGPKSIFADMRQTTLISNGSLSRIGDRRCSATAA
jgi:hypothetical protein